jgi:VWFA-related protein
MFLPKAGFGMLPRCVVSLTLLLLSIPAAPQSAKPPDTTDSAATFKAKARLVLVDVVVSNDKGDPVTGLQKKDFEILEDGKPQTIANFEEHRAAPPTQIKLPPLPPGVYTNFPLVQSADFTNIVLLDALNTPSADQHYVRTQMIKYLKAIPPGTRVGVFTLASQLRMLQGVTTDSSELLAALNGTKEQQSALLASGVENDANQRRIEFLEQQDQAPTPQTFAQAAIDPVNVAKQFLADTATFQAELRIRITLDALQQLGRYLSSVPGRKNVIWFSGSFPTGIFPDPDLLDPFNMSATFQQEIRKTADLLSAAQVAIYPVAAEGLATDVVYQANGQEIGQKRPSLAMRDQVQEMQKASTTRDLNHNTMEELAKDTGGKAFYNTNGLDGVLNRVVENGARYYSLAYTPTNAAMDGKFRRIQVRLTSGKETLAYRRGYYADDLGTELGVGRKPETDPLIALSGRNLPNYSQVLYKLLVQPLNPQPPANSPLAGSNTDLKGPLTRYGVDFAISVADLKLDPAADGARHGNLEIALIAYDREGKPLNLVVTKGDVSLNPAEYAAVQKGGLQIHKEIDLPTGYVFLRTGVYDLASNKAGTFGVTINVAAPPAK